MDTEVLGALYKILKNTSVSYCELQRPEISVKMRLSPGAFENGTEERPTAPVAAVTEAGPVEDKAKADYIRSEDVGIFYAAKQAVKPGDMVKEGQVIGTIESMGISHNVQSRVSGKVVTQKVRNKEPVEYGEIIFEVEKE